MKKTALITLYSEDDNFIFPRNGFSFGRHMINADDIFINTGDLPDTVEYLYREKLGDYEEIMCSLSFTKDLESIIDIVDDRWVLGGPLIECYGDLIKEKYLHTPRFVKRPFEDYINIPDSDWTLSESHRVDYDYEKWIIFNAYWEDYFKDHSKRLMFNCSLSRGCHWGKCRFCLYPDIESKNSFKRSSAEVERIFQTFPKLKKPSSMHLCSPASTIKQTEIIFNYREYLLSRNISDIIIFNKVNGSLIKLVKKQDSLKGMVFSIGLEAFCQEALGILNKGADINQLVEFCEIVNEKGGGIAANIMDRYCFFTEEMYQASKPIVDRLALIPPYDPVKNTGCLAIARNGHTMWPLRELEFIRKHTSLIGLDIYSKRFPDLGQGYYAYPEKDSEADIYTKKLNRYILDSGMFLSGVPLYV